MPLPLYSCLTSFNSLPELDKKTAEGGVCARGRLCVSICARVCTVSSCDLVPSWQPRAVNRGPLPYKESTYTQGNTHNSQSMPDCRPPTTHLACCYYVTSVLCVCVHWCVFVCDCVSPADTICSVLCELVHTPPLAVPLCHIRIVYNL